ncbi:aspartyl/asparaginyl beta-hydroxylase domain-containing protein [Kordia sp. YSTF-M3]|uniref:Aspartyl/asparaginyl beta-hydroxylase domain-containing protein n=1 Tax=Kordia aestuariivivens TaxID=2759037 RepID=A0ABR7Q858_9FLAO|nr:aspartyl/asparaginyl beta-hydroxylase domain-containing protein [Kordia aestuariivivens]MBC8754536.1 aspartyl/asparaginyl beta-hydroxylase domain-containing protein [Kordia aestuariivivens]
MNSLKLPFAFDANTIKKELAQFSKTEYRDVYNPSVALETLWLKEFIYPIGTPDEIPTFYPNDALKKCPYMLSIFETFKCRVETFRIHTLDAGAAIQKHTDSGYSFEQGKVRLHIPVYTNDKVEILLNDEPVVMQEGECWYCNFNIHHEVKNNSDQPRAHIILDCMVNDWLTGVFAEGGYEN